MYIAVFSAEDFRFLAQPLAKLLFLGVKFPETQPLEDLDGANLSRPCPQTASLQGSRDGWRR